VGRQHDIIVMGASMGGIEAISTVLAGLPAELEGSIFVVQHVGDYGTGLLDKILQRVTNLRVSFAVDREPFQKGHVYIARPGMHLLIEESTMRITRGPRENRTRPAIDPLFRSAAVIHGPHAVGVVLTGMLNDGTAGLRAIERCGGKTVVQDPLHAQFPEMPSNAVRYVAVNYCVSLPEIPRVLVELTKTDAGPPVPIPAELVLENQIAEAEMGEIGEPERIGQPVPLSCPECGGTLVVMKDGELSRFRCHTGHAFTGEVLMADQTESIERSLWAALRALHERAALASGLAEEARAAGAEAVAANYDSKAAEANFHAERIHDILTGISPYNARMEEVPEREPEAAARIPKPKTRR
jgi:two-component system chemotaxis response regulator CheB